MIDVGIGLLVLRTVIGLLLVGHGIQKVSWRLGGAGLRGGAAEFAADGFRGGAITALAAGASQIISGLLLVFGGLTPIAAAAGIGVMTVALTVKAHHGLWVQHDGYEYPLVLITVLTALSLTGPGILSIDHLASLDALPLWVGIAATLLGIVGGLAVRFLLHTTSAQPKDQ